MGEPLQIAYYSESDGEPWALFTEGHIDLEDFAAAAKAWCAEHGYDIDDFGRDATPQHLYMHELTPTELEEEEGEGVDEDYAWRWCDANVAGALAVTAYRP